MKSDILALASKLDASANADAKAAEEFGEFGMPDAAHYWAREGAKFAEMAEQLRVMALQIR